MNGILDSMFNLVCTDGHLHYSPKPGDFVGTRCGAVVPADRGSARSCGETLISFSAFRADRGEIELGITPSAEEPFAYRLLVLTNGRPCLRQTLESFAASVTPLPAESMLVADGGEFEPFEPFGPWQVVGFEARGFCGATAEAWKLASEPGPEFVFWTEDDFHYERPLDLRELAEVLRAHPQLTQMALMRGPANAFEEAAGGVREARPEMYTERDGWLESRTNHSTGCSLMRREFMAQHPWPNYPNCEGLFSIELLGEGYSFGCWGLGEPWVQHVGVRSGSGY